MVTENKFVRVAPDAPDRCQGVYTHGQCPYRALPKSQYCTMHAGRNSALQNEEKRIYRLTKWQNRVGQIADHEQVKSLREEIGILRILMEEILNMCNDSSTLLMYSNRLSDLALRIEKLVNTCHKLELSTGLLLDKSTALNIGAEIVEVISKYVSDEGVLEQIGESIITTILKLGSKNAETDS